LSANMWKKTTGEPVANQVWQFTGVQIALGSL